MTSSEHELLGDHLTGLIATFHRQDPLVRAGSPDAVHQLRVVLRRLRSVLRTFRRCLDPALVRPVRREAAWLGEVLGRPRDLEVLGDRLLRAEPDWLGERLRAEHDQALRRVGETMASQRYQDFVALLDGWVATPTWPGPDHRPVRRRVRAALEDSRRALLAAYDATVPTPGPYRERALHELRRRAKQTRYAADVLVPVLGERARELSGAAEGVQDALGELHDLTVAAAYVHALGLDLLGEELESAASVADEEFERVWRTTTW